MDYQEVIELIKIERECVNRNNQPFGMNCDRECGKCDLLQNADDLIEMYNDILEWLEELKEYRAIGTLEEVRNAAEKQIQKKMVIIGCEEKRIARCPLCSRNMAVAYLRDGEILGTQCIGDVPNVANYCKFCGQALLLDWSEEE